MPPGCHEQCQNGAVGRARGTAVLQVVKVLRNNREKVLAVLAPELRHYLDDQIERRRWYPDTEFLPLFLACAQVVPASDDAVWDFLGRGAADNDLQSVYRGMIARNRTLVETITVVRDLFRMYYDTGRVVVTGDQRHARWDTFDL